MYDKSPEWLQAYARIIARVRKDAGVSLNDLLTKPWPLAARLDTLFSLC